ncbi:DNA repair protein RAD51 homolog 3-like [Sycon ciliatum]|uniref:DNA repair protein RAD51 homolog 3-like n=1 Tax=Sycon ciliatum TaxID=27933 RepID=UPI0020A9C237|eukprot:scpid83158/ scgid24073/ DNA repair protein RAD51 homolog 3; RAD51 homolog C; RAD51-like protein 2
MPPPAAATSSKQACTEPGKKVLSTYGFTSCADQLKADIVGTELNNIVTCSKAVDDLMEGGIPISQITEITSKPGAGKSLMCLQIAVDAHIPISYGGVGGETLYIDCDGRFSPTRCNDIAQATVDHLQYVSLIRDLPKEIADAYDLKSVLSSIMVQYVPNYLAFFAVLHQIPDFLATHPKVKLIVIDSIAGVFRNYRTDYVRRSQLLISAQQILLQIATRNKLAVVITNQTVTRFRFSQGKREVYFRPALGDSWGHAAFHRILIEGEHVRRSTKRVVTVQKSSIYKRSSAAFQITEDGVRAHNVYKYKIPAES